MITEEKLIVKYNKAKTELKEIAETILEQVEKNDYDGALEFMAILNANLVACIICDDILNIEA